MATLELPPRQESDDYFVPLHFDPNQEDIFHASSSIVHVRRDGKEDLISTVESAGVEKNKFRSLWNESVDELCILDVSFRVEHGPPTDRFFRNISSYLEDC